MIMCASFIYETIVEGRGGLTSGDYAKSDPREAEGYRCKRSG
jgi:hypothetical protein